MQTDRINANCVLYKTFLSQKPKRHFFRPPRLRLGSELPANRNSLCPDHHLSIGYNERSANVINRKTYRPVMFRR